MRTRPFTTSAVGLVAAGLLAATGCSQQAAAIRVDDDSVSQSDFMDEVDRRFDELVQEAPSELLDEDGDWPQGESPRGDTAGGYEQEFIAAVVPQRVEYMVWSQLFEEEGLEVTDADRRAAEEQVAAGGFPLDLLPEDLQEDLLAMIRALQQTMGDEDLAAATNEIFEGADVEISARYGTWDSDAFAAGQPPVSPPEGPLVQSDGDGGEVGPGELPSQPPGAPAPEPGAPAPQPGAPAPAPDDPGGSGPSGG